MLILRLEARTPGEMFFRSTYFHNFRNLVPQRRTWSPGFNVITGQNGAGKTNFLEGLNIISGWGPLEKGTRMASLIDWRNDGRVNDSARGRGRASLWAGISGEEDAEIFASVSTRCALKFGGSAVVASTMRGRMPVLSFLSGHISLIKGSASSRRQILDRVGSLISPSYALRLGDYRRVLKHRSILLRRFCDTRPTDAILISTGSWIWTAREEITRLIVESLKSFSDLLAVPMEVEFERGGGGLCDSPSDDFKASMTEKKNRERAAKIPMVGPQRDDLKLSCNGREAAVVLSRGQGRRAASAIALSAAAVVERSLGRKPVLIFDEITSELDERGRDATFEALMATGCQVFAATTDPVDAGGVEIFRIQEGKFI